MVTDIALAFFLCWLIHLKVNNQFGINPYCLQYSSTMETMSLFTFDIFKHYKNFSYYINLVHQLSSTHFSPSRKNNIFVSYLYAINLLFIIKIITLRVEVEKACKVHEFKKYKVSLRRTLTTHSTCILAIKWY